MSKSAAVKKEEVELLVKLLQEFPIVGLANIENLPAPQLQNMRAQLREGMRLIVSKKTLMLLAFDRIKDSRKGVEKLAGAFTGMPALIFTRQNPFKLASLLRKSKSKAPAKPGQTAPADIIIPAGPTPFAPGPIISELSSIGLKTGVEGGKVAVKEAKVVVKGGQVIDAKVAGVLSKLGIEPMEIGLNLIAIYDDGTIYGRDVLSVDDSYYVEQLCTAAAESLALALHTAYPAKETIRRLLGKAFLEAKALAIGREILSDEVVRLWLGRADREMRALKAAAGIPDEALAAAAEEKHAEVPAAEAQKVAVDVKPAAAEAKKKVAVEAQKGKSVPAVEKKEADKQETASSGKLADAAKAAVETEIDRKIGEMAKKSSAVDPNTIAKLAGELQRKGTLRGKH